MKDNQVFVTGASGFIGSHLCEKLLAQGYYVIGYDNIDPYYAGKQENLQDCLKNPNFKLVEGTILDFDSTKKAMRGSETVFHLAAQPGVRFSSENPWKTTSTNVNGTLNVLLAARDQKVSKVVFASSSSVYGIPESLPCMETQEARPLSIYGASKLAGEVYCQTFSQLYSLPVAILRYHTVYGPRQRPDMAIRKFTHSLLKGESVTIYGDGEQTRDFTYVADAVDATILASKKGGDGIFNVGRGESVTVNELIRLLTDVCGVSLDSVVHENTRPDDMPDTLADISKARKMLGYSPKVSLRQGLESFVEWYKPRIRLKSGGK